MKNVVRYLSFLALVCVIAPPLAFMLRMLTDESLMKGIMLAGTAVWFVTAPMWMRSADH